MKSLDVLFIDTQSGTLSKNWVLKNPSVFHKKYDFRAYEKNLSREKSVFCPSVSSLSVFCLAVSCLFSCEG